MSSNIEIWDQDQENLTLKDRDLNTFGPRSNFLFPPNNAQNQTQININTKNNTAEHITYGTNDLRNVTVENNLFHRTDPKTRDILTLKEAQNLSNNQRLSDQQLYRKYHAHEINSLCYPNIDYACWGNTTKALYTTNDHRNHNLHKFNN